MTPADAERFFAALAAVAEIFERELSDAAQTLYFDALADLDLEPCLRALGEAAKSNTFMPRPAEIRAFVGGGSLDPDLAAEAAWLEFQRLAKSAGGYRSPMLMNGALAETILAVFGSWESACWTEYTSEMWVAKRKEFGRVYAVKCAEGEKAARQLIGYCDRRNYETGITDTLLPQLPEPSAPRQLPPARTREEWITDRDAERAQQKAEFDARSADVNRKVEEARLRRLLEKDTSGGVQ